MVAAVVGIGVLRDGVGRVIFACFFLRTQGARVVDGVDDDDWR